MQKRHSKHWRKPDKNNNYILVLDVGTTGVKAFVFDKCLNPVSRAYAPLKKYFPKRGWVEQNPAEILSVSKKVLREAVKKSGMNRNSCVGLGITNQRETTILWDKKTDKPAYPAIVWEDARTKRLCAVLQKQYGNKVRQKTGLAVDPYFSATKIRWIITHSSKAEKLLKNGTLAFGTVDSWILWNFVKGNPHFTDYTNASRTLLFNIRELRWDGELLAMFGAHEKILPRVLPSSSHFGVLKKDIIGFSAPVLAVCGDQQASMYAAGAKIGATKVTYGTGTFIMQVLGKRFMKKEQFFTTLVPHPKNPWYALEAKIACCGKKAEVLLSKPKQLQKLLTALARNVDRRLRRLPFMPKEVVIDGGVARDRYLALIQARVSHTPIRKQKIFDGTALGAAQLIKDNLV